MARNLRIIKKMKTTSKVLYLLSLSMLFILGCTPGDTSEVITCETINQQIIDCWNQRDVLSQQEIECYSEKGNKQNFGNCNIHYDFVSWVGTDEYNLCENYRVYYYPPSKLGGTSVIDYPEGQVSIECSME